MDRTTSLIIFGPVITVLAVIYAGACVQYIIVEFSLWQIRREIKLMNKDINNCVKRLVALCNEQQMFIQQLNAEVTVYEDLAARFAVPLESHKTLDQVEALKQVEAWNNECFKQHRVIMKFRAKLRASQKETMAIRRELGVQVAIHMAKIRNIGARQRTIEAWRSVISYIVCLSYY